MMNTRAQEYFHKIQAWIAGLPNWTVPLVLLGVLLAAFAPFLTQLGFYQDDWHHLYYGYQFGLPGLRYMFLYDGRPFAAWLYEAGFSVLGFAPLHWQISTLMLRFLTVLFTWLSLRELWPRHQRAVTWVALLFVVYPLFQQQFLSVAYALHWTGYWLYSVSIWAMLKSIRQPHRYVWWLLLALLTGAAGLLLIEYFVGIELIRPALLWIVYFERQEPLKTRLRKVIQQWLPYALMLAGFVVYRLFLIPVPDGGEVRNSPTMLLDLLRLKLPVYIQLIQTALQDTLFALVTTWNNVFTPEIFQLTRSTNLKILIISAALAVSLFIYLRATQWQEQTEAGEAAWSRQALVVGLLLTILGLLPGWLADKNLALDNPQWSGRLGLASMLGVSLVFVALLELLVHRPRYRALILVALIAFATAFHLLHADEFRLSWSKQTDFFHQLYWRAPYLVPQTALLSDEEIFSYMGEYPTAYALSSLYPIENDSSDLPYWFYSLLRRYYGNVADLTGGTEFTENVKFRSFQGNSLDSLVIYYRPEDRQCLWVLSPENANLRILPEILQETAPISNLNRIQSANPNAPAQPGAMFGPEPPPDWCFYFQKGDLARQIGDWTTVVNLWVTAAQAGFEPQNGVEYLPFIEGYAHLGQWAEARQLSVRANQLTQGMKHSLCPLWDRLEDSLPGDESRQAEIDAVRSRLECGK